MPKFHNLPIVLHPSSPTFQALPDDADILLKQADVRAILNLADATLEQWRLKGQGPKFVKLGRAVRYRLSDVQAYISGLSAHNSTTEADVA